MLTAFPNVSYERNTIRTICTKRWNWYPVNRYMTVKHDYGDNIVDETPNICSKVQIYFGWDIIILSQYNWSLIGILLLHSLRNIKILPFSTENKAIRDRPRNINKWLETYWDWWPSNLNSRTIWHIQRYI